MSNTLTTKYIFHTPSKISKHLLLVQASHLLALTLPLEILHHPSSPPSLHRSSPSSSSPSDQSSSSFLERMNFHYYHNKKKRKRKERKENGEEREKEEEEEEGEGQEGGAEEIEDIGVHSNKANLASD